MDVIRLGFDEIRSTNPTIISVLMNRDMEPSEWVVEEEEISELIDEGDFRGVQVEFEHIVEVSVGLFD